MILAYDAVNFEQPAHVFMMRKTIAQAFSTFVSDCLFSSFYIRNFKPLVSLLCFVFDHGRINPKDSVFFSCRSYLS